MITASLFRSVAPRRKFLSTVVPALVAALGIFLTVAAQADTVIVVGTNTYSAFSTALTNGQWVYVDADPAAGSPVRATQRALGYREVDYKSAVPATLYFNAVTPATNGGTVTYDYSAQVNKTNLVGFWVAKDLPIIIGPDGNAYITDGHHTTAGYFSPASPIRQWIEGKNRIVTGHIVANYFDTNTGPQVVSDAWWTARAAENNAFLYGRDGDQLTLPGEPNYASLQPVLPSVLAMPTTPSSLTTNGAIAMTNSDYRGLTWGMADAMVVSGTTPAGAKIAGYKKAAPGSSVDINFVEFYWADFLRHRVVWDNLLSGSPLGSPNGDASATAAPLSFFTAVANGIALARSEVYRDEYGRLLSAYTNSALFPPVTVNWANGSLSNGLAGITDTYQLYLRDDTTIVGDVSPSAKSTNILHIDTVTGLTPTQAMQNIRTALINAGGTLKTSWKDTTVSNTTLTLPKGTGTVTVNGTNFTAANTILGGGTLLVEGTLGGNLSVTNGVLNGHGLVNGALTVSGSGMLAPGASIGTISINGPLTLSATTAMEISKTGAALTNDLVNGITTLAYGGTLALIATGDALVAGDAFKLFDATTYSGAFATLNLPVLDLGLAWDTSALITTGTISVGVSAATAPIIAAQPASRTNDVGTGTTLVSGAVGTEPISYQWQFNGGDLAGQTNTTLALSNIQESNQGAYTLLANNAAGSVTSVVATLTVNQAPTAQAQALLMQWNTSTNLTLAGTDPDGDTLTYAVVTPPAHGVLSGSAPNVTYTPVGGYSGPDSFTFRVHDGRLNSGTATASITINRDFTYVDTDLLLVFRKGGFNDLLYNLGSVSNYLGQPNGFSTAVTNFNLPRLQANFGGSLAGVKYALLAVTTASDAPLRVWMSDSAPGAVLDETFSKWASQRSKINAVGTRATAYSFPEADGQSLSIPPSDPNSYTYIASTGGSLDVATLSGASPFPVEQDVTSSVRFFEIKVATGSPKPAAVLAGHFSIDSTGNVTFTGGFIAPSITAQPASTSAECVSGSASFTVAATGDEPLSYQWYHGASAIGGAVGGTLNISPATAADAGIYWAVVSNSGGSVTSSVVTLTITDGVPPVLTVPANITVARTSASGAAVNFTATASDACAGALVPVCTPSSGSTFPVGTTTVVCTTSDGSNAVTNSFTVTVQPGFLYQDTDLLLVFRKGGFNDLLYNLGSVSNYLGQPNGFSTAVTNFNLPRLQANFGGSLAGVKYALLAVTTASDAPLRVWMSDSAPGAVLDETFSKWASQRSKINAVGSRATAYSFPEATNQSLSLPPSDPNSYTYIASTGGSLDAATLSGATAFPVEQDVTSTVRFFEIKVSGTNPKPAAVLVGNFTVSGAGTVTFQANRVPVAVDDGGVTPVNQPVNFTSASLLANDSDPDGDALSIVSVSATSTNGGAVSLSLGTVTYTPVNGFSGSDRFSYTISDGRSGSATASVEVYVSATALPAPNHLTITPDGGGYRLLFAAVRGQTYDLQRTTDLTTAVWTTLTTVLAPPSGIIEYTDSTPPLPNAFYKIVSQ